MLRYYETNNQEVIRLENPIPGSWIRLTDPSYEEGMEIAERFAIDPEDLMASIDLEEKNRIDLNDGYTLIIIDIPTEEIRHDRSVYTTIPLGILLTEDNLITVSSRESPIMQVFASGNIKDFSTRKKLRFIYQIILQTTLAFQDALRDIDQKRRKIESDLGTTTGENELIGLHELESTLVYFATSLNGNANVLSRLTRYKKLEQYPEDRDLLDDVIIENQQAREMSDIYRNIIDSTRDLVSSLLDKRLNNVMKILTSITLILAIPTVISGLYGMNLNRGGMPFSHALYGFGIICVIIVIICAVLYFILKRKRML